MKHKPVSHFAIRIIIFIVVLALALLYDFARGLIHNHQKEEAQEVADTVMENLLRANKNRGHQVLSKAYNKETLHKKSILYGEYKAYPYFYLYRQQARIQIVISVYSRDPSQPREELAQSVRDIDTDTINF